MDLAIKLLLALTRASPGSSFTALGLIPGKAACLNAFCYRTGEYLEVRCSEHVGSHCVIAFF